MDYEALGKRPNINVQVKYKDSVLANPNTMQYVYSELELADGESGPMPTEQEFIDEQVLVDAEKANHAAFVEKLESTNLEELRPLMCSCNATEEDVHIALNKLIQEVLYLRATLEKNNIE